MDRESNLKSPTEPGLALSEALANQLRALGQALIDQEIAPERLLEVTQRIKELTPLLEGQRRTRWYEGTSLKKLSPEQNNTFELLSPFRGRLNSVAPPLYVTRGERDDGTPCMVGRTRLSCVYEGPPRGVHGGVVAALFDEILGAAMALSPPSGVTAKLEVDYHHLTPLDEDLILEAWIGEVRDRRIHAEATCYAGETLTARARALFIRVDFEAVENRMKARSEAQEEASRNDSSDGE